MEAATGGSASSAGKYHLLTSLGRGGMAEVFLAVVAGPGAFNKLLVVKLLRAEAYRSSAELTRMFLDEARIAARLNHPNIVQTYEVGELHGRYYIAMEYLEGQTLREVQRRLRNPSLPIGAALRVIVKTARGLHHAHELKGFDGKSLEVVHRDVSPHNVFLTYDGQVKLLDFGIAKATDSENFTKAGVVKGKLDYIAPEQLRGDKADRRADIFSLGVLAWELITGVRYAGGADVEEAAKYRRRLQGREPKLRSWKRDVPERLEAIVERALALDPAQRYPTAAEFADALEAFLEEARLRPRGSELGERVAEAFAAERAQLAASMDRELKHLRFAGGRSLRSGRLLGSEGVLAYFNKAGERRGAGRLRSSRLVVCAAIGALAASLAWFAPRSKTERRVPSTVASSDHGHTLRALRSDAYPAELTSVQPEVAPAPATVRLQIEVWPQNAETKLDGAVLPSSPFVAELRRDGATHHVEASAAGYASKRVLVPFDHDRLVKIELQKVVRHPVRARAPGAPALSARGSTQRSMSTSTPSTSLRTASRAFEPGEPIGLRPAAAAAIDIHDPYAL